MSEDADTKAEEQLACIEEAINSVAETDHANAIQSDVAVSTLEEKLASVVTRMSLIEMKVAEMHLANASQARKVAIHASSMLANLQHDGIEPLSVPNSTFVHACASVMQAHAEVEGVAIGLDR